MLRLLWLVLVCVSLCAGTPELPDNDSVAGATPLSLVEEPAGSRLFVGFGDGAVEVAGDLDYWRFEALAGDRITVAAASPESGLNPFISVRNSADGQVASDDDSGPNVDAQISGYSIPSSGTYYLRVSGEDSTVGAYSLRLYLSRGPDLESDPDKHNDLFEQADRLSYSPEGSTRHAAVAGDIEQPDGSNKDQDCFDLGLLQVGARLELDLDLLTGSSLLPKLQVFDEYGSAIADEDGDPLNGAFRANIPEAGRYYARVEAAAQIYNGFRYLFTASQSWEDAETEALSLGGHLASVTDADERLWILRYAGNSFWIGLSDRTTEGVWAWADGSPLDYSDWASNEPTTSNAGARDYAYVASNQSWYSADGNATYPGLVKFADAGANAQTGPNATYHLRVRITDTTPPRVVRFSPAASEGAVSFYGWNSFTLAFDEAIAPGSALRTPSVALIDGHAYLMLEESLDSADAYDLAAALGGYRVSIGDAAEQQAIYERFGKSSFMLGLTRSDGVWSWDDGSPFSYANWGDSEPDSQNSALLFSGDGSWRDLTPSTLYPVLVEMDPATIDDSDGDGIPYGADPFPGDALNAYDLREAGADGLFDTADDVSYQVRVRAHDGEAVLTLEVEDGPPLPGDYRFTVTTSLADTVVQVIDGNGDGTGGDAFVRHFTIEPEGIRTPERRFDHGPALATPLSLTELSGSGILFSTAPGHATVDPVDDIDWWSFEGQAGDRLTVAIDSEPGRNQELDLYLYRPDGSLWTQDTNQRGPRGGALLTGLTLSESGTYRIRVTDTRYIGHYEVRVGLARGAASALESDSDYANDTLDTANALTLVNQGASSSLIVAGRLMGATGTNLDQDSFDLGAFNAGNLLEVALAVPPGSTLVPVLAVTDAAGTPLNDENPDPLLFRTTLAADGRVYARITNQFWVFDGKRYTLTASKDWQETEADAVALGAHLATIDSFREGALLSHSLGYNHWIGLNDLASEGNYAWADGTAVSYTAWANNEPTTSNPSGKDAVYAGNNGFWYSTYASNHRAGIVEQPDPDGFTGPLGSGNDGLYLMQITLTDTVPPRLVARNGLPAEGEQIDPGLGSFTLTFSETLDAGAAISVPDFARFNGHTYLTISGTRSWSDARSWAQSLGGDLIMLTDSAEQDWFYARFGKLDYWLGLSDAATEGTWLWLDGTPLTEARWATNEPGGNDYAFMNDSNGLWYDSSSSSNRYAAAELDPGALGDADDDGLPDAIDPYPSDPSNGWELRHAGADGLFDTADDPIYNLRLIPTYDPTSTQVSLRIEDGPLQPGSHRFTISATVRDTAGNAIDGNGDGSGGDAFVRLFQVVEPEGGVSEPSANHSRPLAQALSMVENPVGSNHFVSEQHGLGSINPGNDVDWWSFDGLAGDRVSVYAHAAPHLNQWLRVSVYAPDGTRLVSGYRAGARGGGYHGNILLPADGNYGILIEDAQDLVGGYELTIELVRGGLQMESDANYGNDLIEDANQLTLTENGAYKQATVAGVIQRPENTNHDQDVFALGRLNQGDILQVGLRLPVGGTLVPRLRILDAAGAAIADSDDRESHFQGAIPLDGDYYAHVSNDYVVFEGKRYDLTGNLNWNDSRAQALSLGYDLVTIDSAAERTFLHMAMGGTKWMGLNDVASEGVWVWADGTPVDFTAWASGQPLSGYQDASIMNDYGWWESEYHASSRYGLMERVDPDGLTGPLGPGPLAQYLMDVQITDGVPPQVVAISRLPEEGGQVLNGISNFTVTLSETPHPSSVATVPIFGSFGNDHYVLATTTMNRPDAESFAQSLNGQLPTPADLETQQWLHAHFGTANLWMGINDAVTEGTWVNPDGSTPVFTHWYPGEPNSSGNDYAYLYGPDGLWRDTGNSSSYRAVAQIDAGLIVDGDGDGLADAVDPYPTDPANGWQLVGAGEDGLLGTADDSIYNLRVSGYDGSNLVPLTIEDGPMALGLHRLTVTTSVTDVVGNPLDGNGDGVGGDVFERTFEVVTPTEFGIAEAAGGNHTGALAQELPLAEAIADTGYFQSIDHGYGSLEPSGDNDWWYFEAEAGDWVNVIADAQAGTNQHLRMYVYGPTGTQLAFSDQNGPRGGALSGAIQITQSGRHEVRIYDYYSRTGRYELYLELSRGGLVESDRDYGNDAVTNGNPITMTNRGAVKGRLVAGTLMDATGTDKDQDSFALGRLEAGNELVIEAQLPATSTLTPEVLVYDEAGELVADEEPDSARFRATLSATGDYSAHVRPAFYRFGDRRFETPGVSQSWVDGEATAVTLGGHLASIHSDAERWWLFHTMGYGYWIGLNDIATEGTWVWSDGTPTDFTAWGTNQPSSGYEDGALIGTYGYWESVYTPNSRPLLIVKPDPDGIDGTTGPGSFGQYLLDIQVHDTQPPQVIAGSRIGIGEAALPGTSSFSLTFNEELERETVGQMPDLGRFGSHVYLLSEGGLTFDQALTWARDLGGDLVSIADSAEQNWVYARFGLRNLWLGLNDIASEGNHVWSDGSPVTFTNFANSEPDGHDGVIMSAGNGLWYDANPTSSYYAVAKLPAGSYPDGDADDVPDSLDPYPSDALNGFELRAAGSDGLFDTADDILYELRTQTPYNGGRTVSFDIGNGALVAGSHRLIVTPSITDLVGLAVDGNGDGNGGDALVHYFDAVAPDGFVGEQRFNRAVDAARALNLVENPVGSGYYLSENHGLGTLEPTDDADYWRFEAQAGDRVAVWADTYNGNPNLTLQLYNPSGSLIETDESHGPGSDAYISNRLVDVAGSWLVRVTSAGGNGFYDLHVELARGIDLESDAGYANDTIANGNTLTFIVDGDKRAATIGGVVMAGESGNVDEDSFNLGTVTAGETILLNVRQPLGSSLQPVIEIRDASGAVVGITPNPGDAVARYDVTTPGTYYGLLVGLNAGGPRGHYLLDTVVQPTAALDFADLFVNEVTAPTGAASGQTIDLTWTVGNYGALPSSVTNWTDLVVLSLDQQLGNGDDVQVAQFVHNGALAVNESYAVNQSVQLPRGISGTYYLYVRTDYFNQVPEFIFEDNNATAAAAPISITLTPAADLRAQSITDLEPALAGTPVTVSWQIDNSGNGTSGDGTPGVTVSSWTDRLVLSANQTFGDGDDILLADVVHSGALAASASYTGSWSGNLPSGLDGSYYVMVRSDVLEQVYEYTNLASNLVISANAARIYPSPFADLAIAPVASPASAPWGESLSLSWTVTNTTEGFSDTPVNRWWDSLTLSADAELGNGDDIVLARVRHDGVLARGDSYSASATVTIPDGLLGDYTLFYRTDIYGQVAERDLTANNTSAAAIQLTEPPRPDLQISELRSEPRAYPGAATEVSITLTNPTELPLAGNLETRFYLSADQAVGDDYLFATYHHDVDLPAGGTLTLTELPILPADPRENSMYLVARTDVANAFQELDETNNAAVAEQATELPPTLTLVSGRAEIGEDADPPGFQMNVIRNGSLAQSLVVSISGDITDELSYPSTVTIPNGQAATSFAVSVLPDDAFDGDQLVGLTATASGMREGQAWVTVVDDDQPALSLGLSATELAEDGSIQVTVTREGSTEEPVSIFFDVTPKQRVSLPDQLDLASGEASGTITLDGIDDALLRGDRQLELIARAPGLIQAEADITLLDNDLPMLTLALDAPNLLEGETLRGTVHLDAPVSEPLQLRLVSGDPTILAVQGQLAVPADSSEARFILTAVNDGLLTGPRTVSIDAIALDAITGDEVAYLADASLTIDDDEEPALRLELSRDLAPEGLADAGSIYLSRNTETSGPLTVQLSNNAPLELSHPTEVTIPAGQMGISFAFSTLDDGVQDGDVLATLTATAIDHASANGFVTVTDTQLPDLKGRNLLAPTSALTGQVVNISYTVLNQGIGSATAGYTEQLWLSPDPVLGKDDIFLAQFQQESELPAEHQIARQVSVMVPDRVGTWYVIAVLDSDGLVGEITDSNNHVVGAQTLTIEPAYTATVYTDTEVADPGSVITLHGEARTVDDQPASLAKVEIEVRVRDTLRRLTTYTGEDGSFTTFFRPLKNEAGSYTVGAAHPGMDEAPVQDSFLLLGLVASSKSLSTRIYEGQGEVSHVLELSNPADLDLDGLEISVIDAPANLAVNLLDGGIQDVPARGKLSLNLGLEALDASAAQGQLVLGLSHPLGLDQEISLAVSIVPISPRLQAIPNKLQASMVRGGQKTVTFTLFNNGGIASGDINVLLPESSWLHLASPETFSLAVGDSADITLVLTPPDDLPLELFEGVMALDGPNFQTLQIPFAFRTVSTGIGHLAVKAVDEAYYYSPEAPALEGATVTLRDPFTLQDIVSGQTDAEGDIQFNDLAEGYYKVEVVHDKHDTYTSTVLVEAGIVRDLTAFLSYQAVSYVWTVTEEEIEERYTISIETTFETVVPKPVVTVEPELIDLSELTEVGDVFQVNMRVVNHGLIRAENTAIQFPSHPDLDIDVLAEQVGDLEAGSEQIIPVRITRIGQSGKRASGGCSLSARVTWSYICGPSRVLNGTPVPILGVSANCHFHFRGSGGSGGGGTISIRGRSGGGGSTFSCECEEFDLLTKDFSSLFKPPAKALATFLTGLSGGTFVFNVKPKATVKLRKCCDEDGHAGLEGRGDASVKVSVSPNTSWSQSVSEEIGIDGGGKIKVSGSVFAGLQVGPYAQIAGFVTTGCNSEMDYGLSGTLGASLMAGVQGKLSGSIYGPGGVQVGESVSVTANGILASDISGTISWSKSAGLDICGQFAGLYAQVGITWPGGSAGLWDGQKKYFLDPIPQQCVNSKSAPLLAEAIEQEVARAERMGEEVDTTHIEALVKAWLVRDIEKRMAAQEEAFARSLGEAVAGNAKFAEGVCARVKLRIDQDVALTRTIFRSRLDLINEDPSQPVEDLDVQLQITGPNGQLATDLFEVREPELSQITAVDGTGFLGPDTTGYAAWVIIPTKEAAPIGDVDYQISGLMTYRLGEATFVIPLEPATVTVRPTAELYIDYFHERDVYADDPFTPQVEPSLPYSLGVLVENRGAGAARNLRISSGQPEIIENEKGLKIAFEIIGSEIDGQPATNSLEANFGDVAAGQRAVGRWLMQSTLQGHFIDYSATFTHDHDLGEDLSQLEEVDIHETLRVVDADSDGLPDFLVNDIEDEFDMPETLYTAQGAIHSVSLVSDATATIDGNSVQLQLSPTPGWTYIRVAEPAGENLELTQVLRGDGTPLDPANHWQTDRTFVGHSEPPVLENILHILDENPSDSYTLNYTPRELDSEAPQSSVDPLPAATPPAFPVCWHGSDDSGGALVYDVYVSIDGGPWELWLNKTSRTGMVYLGEDNRTYAFYSQALDPSANLEAAPATADAQTTTSIVNEPPVFDSLGSLTIGEGETARLTLTASDPDGPDGDLRFEIASAPKGVTLDPITGELVWVTGEPQGATTYDIVVLVTDTGQPAKSTGGVVQITVTEDNSAPTLPEQPARTGRTDGVLSFTVRAQDIDLPAQALNYSLVGTVPTGATIGTSTGQFSWPEPLAGNHEITVRVTDNGSPALSAEQRIVLQVEQANRAPQTTGSVADVNLIAGDPLLVNVPLGSFSDPDGETLSFSASLASGQVLPNWLSFDPNSGILSGTPMNAGVWQVRITARDPRGGTASLQFTITAEARSNGAFSFSAAEYSAGEADGTLELTVQRLEGEAGAVSVAYRAIDSTAANGTHYQLAAGTLSWADGDSTGRTISVALSDTTITADIDFQVVLEGPTGGAGLGDPATATVTLTPVFALTLSAEPSEGGSVEGAGNYAAGTSAPITANPAEGYRFSHWEGGTPLDPNASTTTITPQADTALIAHFVKTWVLTLNAEPAEGGSVTGAGTYDDGQQVTVSATAIAPYRFTGWSGGSVADPSATTTTLTLAMDTTLTASFSDNAAPVVNLSIPDQETTAGEAFGYTIAAGTFSDPDGDTLTLTAELSDGSPLPSWLAFDGETFSGTPAEANVLNVLLTATDPHGAFATTSFDLTILEPPPVEIHGHKFNDLDADGTWDTEEPGLADWQIYLDLNGNGQLDSGEPNTLTDSDGAYAFTDLPAGSYSVAEVQQPGWHRTYAPDQLLQQRQLSNGTSATQLVAMQLNGDGLHDLLAIDASGNTTPWLADGKGGFSAATTGTLGQELTLGWAADLNGDGIDELIGSSASGLHIWNGQGDASFAAAQTLGAAAHDLVVADLDGNGEPDLLALEGDVLQLYHQQAQAFTAATPIGLPAPAARQMVAADLNGDTRLDLVIRHENEAVLTLLYGEATGFDSHSMALGAAAEQMALTDLDGDGYADLIVHEATGLHIHRGRSGTGFESAELLPLNADLDQLTAFDSDEPARLLATSTDGELFLFDAAPDLAAVIDLGSIGAITDIDSDGDGDRDLILTSGGRLLQLTNDRIQTRYLEPGEVASDIDLGNHRAPLTFTVDTTNDAVDANPGDGVAETADGLTSLRAAIMEANALAGPDIVVLGEGTYSLSLLGNPKADDSGSLEIADDLQLRGAGAPLTAIDGAGQTRLLDILPGASVTIEDLTLQHGSSTSAAAGLYNEGTASLTRVRLTGHNGGDGAAIHNRGQLDLNAVTLDENQGSNGAALFNASGASASLVNSTLSGNLAGNDGGAIYNLGHLALNHVTVSRNEATQVGGIRNQGTTTMAGSIVAANLGTADLGGAITSQGYNLVGEVGDATGMEGSDRVGEDALLDELYDGDGGLPAHVPLAGSPAIDSADNATAPAGDQRGLQRPLDGDGDGIAVADRGAVEVGEASLEWLFPDGGETLLLGEEITLQWHSENLAGPIRLERSSDGGASWQTLYYEIPNSGQQDWKVRAPAGEHNLIRVVSVTNPEVTAQSAATFTVPEPTLELLNPSGGETLEIGQTLAIQWLGADFYGDVNLDISRDGGSSWQKIAQATANDGDHAWTVTGPAGEVQIRIAMARDAAVNHTTEPLTILAPSLTVLAPNGGESYPINTDMAISWQAAHFQGDVRIALSRDGGTSWNWLYYTTANDGEATWKVVGAPSDNALIRISSALDEGLADTSDAPFTIPGETIQLLSPDGGEQTGIGEHLPITWQTSGWNGGVRIELSRDGGTSWEVLNYSTEDDGNFDWTVTGPATDNALIRVSHPNNPSANDVSETAFAIAASSLQLLSPDGGEILIPGETLDISWQAAYYPGNVRAELSRDGGASWSYLFVAPATDGGGSWLVSGPATDQALIRITGTGDTSLSDTSDAPFTIAAPSIEVQSPNGGVILKLASQTTIRWTSANLVGDVRIELSRDGGATWQLVYYRTPNDGEQTWTVTAPATETALLRISSDLNPTIQDQSNQPFILAQ